MPPNVTPPSTLYIGLMTGTSLDGIDGALVDLADCDQGRLAVRAHAHAPFDPALAAELLALNRPGGTDELHRGALAGNALAEACAAVVARLLSDSGTAAAEVAAIGTHGQTVRHCPGLHDGIGYTLQLNNPALLAERCGIDVVADLRSRDIAAGGQGAPLVPAFHRAVFGRDGETVAVLNLGGMSNLTVLHADVRTIGFDCGPGNALMDLWCRRHLGKPFDADGGWAASGQVAPDLLASLRADPYFALPPPKSTGRDLFHADWLAGHLDRLERRYPLAPADVQATLLELTASVCADDVDRHARAAERLLVCGGGARNGVLMARLAALLPGRRVEPSDDAGLPADQVEAVAFAWLARCCLLRRPGNLPSVTGARGLRILGAVYPAG
jgi:anhydro-N-acetylmuramic acid kinase